MSSHNLVIAALEAHAPLMAATGGRIRSDLADASDDYPFIIVKRSRLERITGLDGTVYGTDETFEIECWAHTRSASVDVSELAFAALDAAGLVAETAQPDGIDPELLERVTVLSLDV